MKMEKVDLIPVACGGKKMIELDVFQQLAMKETESRQWYLETRLLRHDLLRVCVERDILRKETAALKSELETVKAERDTARYCRSL